MRALLSFGTEASPLPSQHNSKSVTLNPSFNETASQHSMEETTKYLSPFWDVVLWNLLSPQEV